MNDSSRRIFGFVIGLLLGLAYSLVDQLINVVYLPGVPLYHPGTGLFGTILISILGGGLIGLIAAWPEEAIPGVLFSSLVGALLTVVLAFPSTGGGSDAILGTVVLLLMTFFPRVFLFLPMAALIRWVISVWEKELQTLSFSVIKMALSLGGVVFAAGVLGLLSLYPSFGRHALASTNELVKQGMLAQNTDSLPEELIPVDGFINGAQGAYTLELGDNPDLLPVQRPIGPYGEQEYAVFVHFENGFRFGCAFTPTFDDPSCGEY